jgi:hypothetical protein
MHPFALQHTYIAKKTIFKISNGRDFDWKSPRLPRPWNGEYVALGVMSLGHNLLEANAHFETTPTPVRKNRAEEAGLPGRCHFATDDFSRMRTRHLYSPQLKVITSQSYSQSKSSQSYSQSISSQSFIKSRLYQIKVISSQSFI